MILNDVELRRAAFIRPFYGNQIRTLGGVHPSERAGLSVVTDRSIVSFGLSSFGYDIRVASKFKIFHDIHIGAIDPKNFTSDSFRDIEVEPYTPAIIPPNSFALGYSLEHFSLPNDTLGLVFGKSTYARCGIIVCCTPLEPGWSGHLTIEISNTTPKHAMVYAYEGIAQIAFFKGNPCEISYATRKGKYQNQPAEVILPRV